ncbi:MAG TPA: beta-galactosidase [Methylomirabilota bacterium]|nr:beta-galactosidase [Methylomirabilota bacterium]
MITARTSQLFYGGDYNPDQWPESVWPEDVELMKRAGVNLVTVGVFSWAKLQPAAGAYTFDWLDRVFNLLHQNEILVDLATATASPPPWFSRQHPESLPVNESGVRYSPGSRQHYCPNSTAYRNGSAQLVRQLAARYGSHPALAMWHINNEYGAQVGACYCDQCAAQFRVWLQHKYKTLDTLNEHWATAVWSQSYSHWDEILPPRLAPAFVNPAQQLDYRRFMSDSLLGCLLNEKSVLSEITPQIPVTTNFSGEHGMLKAANYFEWAKHVDFVSFNSYPDPLDADPADVAFAYNLQRGLGGGKSWLLMEQPASQVNWRAHNAVKRPGQMRLWSYQALAHGSDGVMFFQWRAARAGAEKFHSGMLPHGGTETRTFREVEQLGSELKKLSSIRGATTRADVALILDWENFWAVELEARPARINYSELVRSYYRALFEPDVPIDIVPPEADFSPYKLVVAPALYLVRHGVAEGLEAFVDNGGTLVMTFFSGIVDASDRVLLGGYPAPFRKLLGIRVEEFDAFGNQLRHIKTPMRGARCTLWADVIRLESAEAVATFTEDFYAHQPAITRNAVGRGLAYYIGTHLEPAFLRSFLAEICVDCGVRPPMRVPAGVEVTTRSNEHGEFLFLLNHNSTLQFVDIGPRIRRDLLSGEMIKGQCQLAPRDARVLQSA